jgi:hypothetical protein
MLEERCNTALVNVRKYKESLKKYCNKSVVQQELNIRDLVLKKDIYTRDKHKFLSPWEGLFYHSRCSSTRGLCAGRS